MIKLVERWQMKYCRLECPIVQEISNYNKKHQNKIIWCPKCNGEITGITETTHKLRYEGGFIEAPGLTLSKRKYMFLYTCDCYAGKERQKQNRMPYDFQRNGDSDKCFRQRNRDRLERKKNKNLVTQSKSEVHIET